MQRVNVFGPPGSGKSFVAAALGRALGLPVVSLDALRHGPGWVEVPDAAFSAQVADAAAAPRWVIDGRYLIVRPLIWPRADTVIWTDLDKPVVMRQVIWRTVRDWATGREQVPGNRERLRNVVQPWHPIRWAWRHHAAMRSSDREWLADARWADITVVRLRSRRDVDAFLDATWTSARRAATHS